MPTATIAEISQHLQNQTGHDFERSVAEAFDFLNLETMVIEQTDAESDVIVEAKYAENPYYVVTECSAVEPQNQVPYTKLGQLRGNFPKYVDERRQKIFKRGYKLVVGKPEFSANARTTSQPDVVLLSVNTLILLLEKHSKFHFSQDELGRLFDEAGEKTVSHINELLQPLMRRLDIYSLIVIALMENPFHTHPHNIKPYTHIDRVIGEVETLIELLRMQRATEDEIKSCIRDLSSPLPSLISLRENNIRLCRQLETLPTLSALLSDLLEKVNEHLGVFRRMQAARVAQ
jgi:hypothetical protein